MDKDCEREISLHWRSYFHTSKILEEDVFSSTLSNKKRQRLDTARNNNHSQGLTPCMLQENPVLRARAYMTSLKPGHHAKNLQPISSPRGDGMGHSVNADRQDAMGVYSVQCEEAQHTVLSAAQVQFVSRLRSDIDCLNKEMQQQKKDVSGAFRGSFPRINLRDYSKVPWR